MGGNHGLIREEVVGTAQCVTADLVSQRLLPAFGGEALPVSDDHRQDASSLGIKHGPNPLDILVGSHKTPHFIGFDQDLDFFSGTSCRMSGESSFHYRTMEVTTTKLGRLAKAIQVANRTPATDEQWIPAAFYVITLWKTLNTHENKGDPRKVDAIAT